MSRQLKNILQFVIGVLLAGWLMYIVYRDTSWDQVVEDMSKADLFWIGMAGVALMGIFVLRALRWQMMLHGSGYPARTGSTILSVLIMYMVNSFTPKLGELVRCTVLYRTDKVSVSAGLGTVFTERVIDALVLFAGVGLIFFVEVQRLGALFQKIYMNLAEKWGENALLLVGIGLLGLVIGGLGLIWYLRRKNSANVGGLEGKFQTIIEQLLEGAKSVFKLEKPWLFLMYTALIWLTLIFMNYCFILSLPDTSGLGFYAALLILFIGGIGWALPVPGGMGTTHFIIVEMFLAFGWSESAGKNIALLSNGMTGIFSILYGLIAFGILAYVIFRRPKVAVDEAV